MKNNQLLSFAEYHNAVGVYGILNKINNKIYIGSSISLYDRICDHLSRLRNNKHHSSHLQRAWNKYKKENFEIIIIELCSLEDLRKKESFYIAQFNSIDREFGYNLTLETETTKIVSQETKNKVSRRMKGKIPYAALQKQKEDRLNGVPHHNVGKKVSFKSKLKRKETIQSWSNEQKLDFIKNMKNAVSRRINGAVFDQRKRCALLDLSGNIIKVYLSAKDILIDYPNFSHSQITKICRNVQKKKNYKGFSFKYVN